MNIYMDSHSPPTASFIKTTDFYSRLESCRSLLVHFDLVIFRNAGNLELDRLVVNLNSTLGSGASGVVFSGRYQDRPVAIKSISTTGYVENDNIGKFTQHIINFNNERCNLEKLNHDNLVKLVGWCASPVLVEKGNSLVHFHPSSNATLFYLVFDLHTPLRTYWLQNKPATPAARFAEFKKFTFQIASALYHMHSNFILHRDLKCDNILVDNAGNAILTDVGASKSVYNMGATIVGTHLAPEVKEGCGYGYKADIYSFGILIWEFFNRSPFLFQNYTFESRNLIWADASYSPAEQMEFEWVKGMFADCTKKQPDERPSIQTILQHFDFVQLE